MTLVSHFNELFSIIDFNFRNHIARASGVEGTAPNSIASKSKDRGMDKQATMAVCEAPINLEQESHPKFNMRSFMERKPALPERSERFVKPNATPEAPSAVLNINAVSTARLYRPSKAKSSVTSQSRLETMMATSE